MAKADGRWPPSRWPPLPTVKFCRVPGTRQRFFCRRRLSAKAYLPTAYLCREPLGPALGKDCLCRVPDRKHSAKLFALGKSAVSGSESIFWIVLSMLVEIHMRGRWFLLLHTTFQKVNSLSLVLHSPCSLASLLLVVWITFLGDNS